ncbi:hypothetical protein BW686_19775 [Pseudomonas syringae]|uniref:Uncharacterized protein n=1 Tax=Pseudomonas syringae TaxID=317 RepID=A0A244ENJ5_PSESX|nr:hypothetical protein [Pseudomonas syringae]OUM05600.1 hypothetical protein BW686_19775 [Pseudomonas syringae]
MKQELNTAVVNAGCLLFFSAPQDASSYSDVMDALLYVQLAASRKHLKFSECDKWSETWLAAALRFGWVHKASEHISEPLPVEPVETVWSCLGRVLADAVSTEAMSRIRSFMSQAGAQPSNSQALRLLSDNVLQSTSHGAEQTQTTLTLQVGLVDSRFNLTLAQLHLVTGQSLTPDFLFEPIEPESLKGNISLTFYSMQLMPQTYAQYRDLIDQALSNRRPALIEPLRGSI